MSTVERSPHAVPEPSSPNTVESIDRRIPFGEQIIASYPHVRAARVFERVDNTSWPGRIDRRTTERPGLVMDVLPGSGVIVGSDIDLLTQRIRSCVVVLLIGPDQRVLVHMNPNEHLPWKQPQRTGKSIADQLRANGLDLAQLRGVIVGTIGYDEDARTQQRDRWSDLKQVLEGEGIGSVSVAKPLPLDGALLYHSAAAPDHALAVGCAEVVAGDGSVQTNRSQLGIYAIDVTPERLGTVEHVRDAEHSGGVA